LGVRLDDTLRASRALMERGFLVLPAGEQAEVLALTPPLTVHEAQLDAFVEALVAVAPPGARA
jgi:4-aminobutyrate aminotransferase-like enzyme